MADSLLSYGITIGVFIAFVIILFAARTKRVVGKKETNVSAPEESKHPPT